MSLRRKLGKLLMFAFLQFGVMAGVQVTQEQIEKLMQVMNSTRVEHVVRDENGEP